MEIDLNTVIYSIEAEMDDRNPADELEFAEDIRYADEQMAQGNVWGWAQVTVTATVQHPNGIDTIEGHDYLCGCMYDSKEDFCKPGGYWEDMKHGALEDLKRKLA